MKLAGIEISPSINLHKKKLQLNGAAVRSKFFVQTYVIALYAESPIIDEDTAINSSIERDIRMIICTPLATTDLVIDNIRNGIKDSVGSSHYAELKESVEQITSTLKEIGIGYKDIVDIYLTSKCELLLYKNEKQEGKLKNGTGFAQALFEMYVGKRPKDKKIKQALLTGF